MKKIKLIGFGFVGFIFLFFIILVISNNALELPSILNSVFGIGFLIIGLSIFVYFISVLLKKAKLPIYIKVNNFEMILVAVLLLVASYFLLSRG
jgi:hypothetical protein